MPQSTWSGSQINQLRTQIETYRNLVKPSALDESGRMPKSFESLQLLTEPDEWARRQETITAQQMRLYEEKFDNNKIMYFHDLWEYVERRLANPDGATVITHPNNPEQHASVPMANAIGSAGPYSHMGAT